MRIIRKINTTIRAPLPSHLTPNRFRYHFGSADTKSVPNIMEVLKKYGDELDKSGVMERLIPRKFTQENLARIISNQRFSYQRNHLSSLDKALSQPIWDLLDRGGKRWRPVLGMLVAQLYGIPREQVYQLSAFCEIIHNGSLIVDDIEDDSSIRRNRQCVHKIYGVDVAINAGNFMYYAPMMGIYKSEQYSPQVRQKLVRIYFEEIVQLHVGQGWDILWHNNDKLEGQYPTQNQYLQMTAHKTGVLARLTARMMCAYVNVPPEQELVLTQFVENLGVAFQIQDDLLNLEGQEFKSTKGYSGEDIHEGKITLMVIHHLGQGSQQSKQRLIQILKMKTTDQTLIGQAISLLNQTKSLQYARQKMHKLIDQAKNTLDEHFPQSQSRELLKQLAEFGIKRVK